MRKSVVVTQHDAQGELLGAYSWDVFFQPDVEKLSEEILALYGDCYQVAFSISDAKQVLPEFLIVMEGRHDGTQN